MRDKQRPAKVARGKESIPGRGNGTQNHRDGKSEERFKNWTCWSRRWACQELELSGQEKHLGLLRTDGP